MVFCVWINLIVFINILNFISASPQHIPIRIPISEHRLLTGNLDKMESNVPEAVPPEDVKYLRKNNKPDKCFGEDRVLDRKCCIFPPFYKGQVARKCGALMMIDTQHVKAEITTIRRQFLHNCEYWNCILDEYELKNPDNVTLSLERFYAHLDRWMDLNPDFKEVMLKAKRVCTKYYRPYMPLSVCEYSFYQGCFRNYVKVDCPRIIEDDPVCLEQRAFFKKCQEFFI